MDYDDISMWVISRIAHQFVKLLVHIFNIAFSTGIFLNEIKITMVIPLFKNGNKSYFSNYVQFYLYHSFRRYGKQIQRATTTILEYK